MKVVITVNDSKWRGIKIDYQNIANVVFKSIGAQSKYKDSEISLVLTDDSEIKELNKKYRKINKPTNVLSFESGDKDLLGDIFISIDTVEVESREQKAESKDKKIINHTSHLFVHGILHLIGYDHLTDSDANKMENLEIKILAKLEMCIRDRVRK